MSFPSQKARLPIIDLPYKRRVEHAIISRLISSKSMEVSEVVSILPQMENVIHDIRGIAIQKFIHFGQQPVIALLVNCLFI